MSDGLLLRLYGPGWSGVRTASGRYVVEGAKDVSPWATIVTGAQHRVMPRDQVEPTTWDYAVMALGKEPNAWAAGGEGRLTILAPHAAEFLLDVPRMQLACTRLQASKLLAAVPMRGRISVVVDTDRHRSELLAEVRRGFEQAVGDRVCAFPFTIENGRVTGLVLEEPKGGKPWWKLW